jgi:hypothetical protein
VADETELMDMLSAQLSEIHQLREVLERLVDEQEGPPSLKSYRVKAWEAAMSAARELIAKGVDHG